MIKPRILAVLTLAALALASAPAWALDPAADACQPDLAALLKPVVESSAQSASLPAVEPTVPTPAFLATFTGYCRCTCSRIKNCNTSADCGGSPCLGGITCC